MAKPTDSTQLCKKSGLQWTSQSLWYASETEKWDTQELKVVSKDDFLWSCEPICVHVYMCGGVILQDSDFILLEADDVSICQMLIG